MTGTTRYYRHFKGGKYKVLAIGQDSESLVPVVVYLALYGDHKVWVRPKEMFDSVVVTCDELSVIRLCNEFRTRNKTCVCG